MADASDLRRGARVHGDDVDGSRWLAALTAFGLGLLAAVMMVAGHAPWEGPELVSLSSTHGIHRGDGFALIPVLVGAWLAWWCLQRRRDG